MGCGLSRAEDVCCTDAKDSLVVENKDLPLEKIKEDEHAIQHDDFKDLNETRRLISIQDRPKSEGTMQAQPVKTASQIEFFRMLDEKIENGIELDEQEEDELRRKEMMESVKKEWEHILSRSMDNRKRTADSSCPPVMDVSDDDENGSLPTVITEVSAQ